MESADKRRLEFPKSVSTIRAISYGNQSSTSMGPSRCVTAFAFNPPCVLLILQVQ